MRFRPHLFFDEKEPWRPVSLDSLALETSRRGRHQMCTKPRGRGDCARLDQISGIATRFLWLDLLGVRENGADASAPRELLARCGAARPLRDCDKGDSAAIYYHAFPAAPVVEEGVPYRYIDYWWFLRYNDAGRRAAFDHEGDWEGMALVLRAGVADPVQWVEVAAHDTAASYLPGAVSWTLAHPWIYVARGTHASYIRACRQKCRQAKKIMGLALPELSSNGRAPWGRNSDVECVRQPPCLRPLEKAGRPFGWVSWPGRWGSTLHHRVTNQHVADAIEGQTRIRVTANEGVAELISDAVDLYAKADGPDRSPCSPLYQARYLSPWLPGRKGRRPASGDCGTPSGQAADCKRWAGAYVVALVCHEGTLKQAIKNGRMTEPGRIRLDVVRGRKRFRPRIASAPGLAQAVGALLEPGDVVEVTGRAPKGAFLVVRARSGGLSDRTAGFGERRFDDLGLDGGPNETAKVIVRRGSLGPRFDYRPAGVRGGGPGVARGAPARAVDPAAIRALSARRRARSVQVVFVTASPRALVAFTTADGTVLAFTTTRPQAGTRKELSFRAPARARNVAVAPVDAAGVVGKFARAPIRS